MAPNKKRKTSPAPDLVTEPPSSDFVNNEARSAYRVLLRKNKIWERGIASQPPFDSYIRQHGWETFCKTPVDANITMASEFYANMGYRSKDGDVLCRGKQVRVTPEIINAYYMLSSDDELYSEFEALEDRAGVDDAGQLFGNWSDLVREVTQDRFPMEEILPRQKWGHIDKKFLTTEMNVWYSFVAARLFPVTINSEVQWERIRILYALKKNMAINVGRCIFSSMLSMVCSKSGWGFLSLVTGLCHRAGCEDRMDDTWKPPMAMLKLESFQRRSKQVSQAGSVDMGSTNDIVQDEKLKSGQHVELGMRVERIERDVAAVRRICCHTAAVIAHAFPEALAVVGPYPEEIHADVGCTPPNSPEAEVDAASMSHQEA